MIVHVLKFSELRNRGFTALRTPRFGRSRVLCTQKFWEDTYHAHNMRKVKVQVLTDEKVSRKDCWLLD